MKNEMRKFLTVLPLIGLVVGVSACREEPEPSTDPSTGGKTNAITLAIGGNEDTKASGKKARAVVTDMIPLNTEEGETPTFLEESVISLDDVYYNSAVDTKGHPMYTENFADQFERFGGVAYQFEKGSGSATPASVSGLTKFNGVKDEFYLSSAKTAKPLIYKYEFEGDHWPKGVGNLLFFMSAPTQVAGSLKGGVQSLDYYYHNVSGKDAGVIEFAYKTPDAAADQTDILFTSKVLDHAAYGPDYDSSKQTAAILFYHALAGVKFKAGNFNDGVTTITKITISGIKNEGTCTIMPQYDADGYVNGTSNAGATTAKSKTVSTWGDTPKGSGTYTIGNGTDAISISSAPSDMFPSSFYGGDKKLGDNNLMDSDFNNVFFFIPQETEGAKVKINYTIKRKASASEASAAVDGYITESYEKEIDFSGRKWYAGELYTYTITAKDLDVYITDQMASSNQTKTDVEVINTGNIEAYMRVAVVANWFDDHTEANLVGKVITNDSWTNNVSINSNWMLGSDGFYYYKYKVKGGAKTTYPIFDSYTTPDLPLIDPKDSSKGSKSGLHLEMDLAVQAVDAANLPTGWKASNITFDTKVDYGNGEIK